MKYAAPVYVITIIAIAAIEYFSSPEVSMLADMYDDPKVVLKPLDNIHIKPMTIFD